MGSNVFPFPRAAIREVREDRPPGCQKMPAMDTSRPFSAGSRPPGSGGYPAGTPANPGVLRLAVGARAEQFAARWLEDRGLAIVARNVRTRWGECDLVARDGPVLVFVEVKWRASTAFGAPAEAVDLRKRRRLTRLAAWYCARTGLEDQPVRFDVVAIRAPSGAEGRWRVEWLRDAFGEGS